MYISEVTHALSFPMNFILCKTFFSRAFESKTVQENLDPTQINISITSTAFGQ